MPKLINGDVKDVTKFFRALGFMAKRQKSSWCTEYTIQIGKFTLRYFFDWAGYDYVRRYSVSAHISLGDIVESNKNGKIVWAHWNSKMVGRIQNITKRAEDGIPFYLSLFVSGNWKTRFIKLLKKDLEFINSRGENVSQLVNTLSILQNIA